MPIAGPPPPFHLSCARGGGRADPSASLLQHGRDIWSASSVWCGNNKLARALPVPIAGPPSSLPPQLCEGEEGGQTHQHYFCSITAIFRRHRQYVIAITSWHELCQRPKQALPPFHLGCAKGRREGTFAAMPTCCGALKASYVLRVELACFTAAGRPQSRCRPLSSSARPGGRT